MDVLHLICEASEDLTSEDELGAEREDLDRTLAVFGRLVPDETRISFSLLREVYSTLPTVALRKFAKNRTLQAMSHVCRSWRAHLIHSMFLWRDIAFDITEPKSLYLAKDFLERIRDSAVTLRIYAGLGNTFKPQVSELFQDLRTHIDRWEVFEYQGELKGYHQYLDLGAQRLLRFSDRHDFSTLSPWKIFASKTPSLRSLTTSEIADWPPSTLSNLVQLNVSYGPQSAVFSLKSLFNVLQSTPNLEVLQLASPIPLILDCAADETVTLPQLKTFRLCNADIYTLITRLQLPSVEEMVFSSDYSHWSEVHPHPTTKFHDIFSPFPQIPLLEQGFSLAEIEVVFLTNGILLFRICLSTADEKYFFEVDLNLAGELACRWRDYLKRSLTKLVERAPLSPGASIHFTSQIPMDCHQFLPFNTVKFITIDGLGNNILEALVCTFHGTPILPQLEELVLLDDRISNWDVLLPLCLQSREDLAIVVRTTNKFLLEGVRGIVTEREL